MSVEVLDAFLWRCEHSRALRTRDSMVTLPVALGQGEDLVDAVARSLSGAVDAKWEAQNRITIDSSSPNAFAAYRFDAVQLFYGFSAGADGVPANSFASQIEAFVASRGMSRSLSTLGVVVTIVFVPVLTQSQVARATAAPGDAVRDVVPRTQWRNVMGSAATPDAVRRVLRGCAVEFVGQPIPVTCISDLAAFHKSLSMAPLEQFSNRRDVKRWRVDGVDGCQVSSDSRGPPGPMDLAKSTITAPDGSIAVVDWHTLRQTGQNALESRDQCLSKRNRNEHHV